MLSNSFSVDNALQIWGHSVTFSGVGRGVWYLGFGGGTTEAVQGHLGSSGDSAACRALRSLPRFFGLFRFFFLALWMGDFFPVSPDPVSDALCLTQLVLFASGPST